MKPTALEAIRRRCRVVWEGACEIAGVGASAAAPHWLAVTEEGHFAFYHGPGDGTPAWTHFVPAPHAPGTVLARWEPAAGEFIFRFDRHWDSLVATLTVSGRPDPRLWAALRPHLLPPAREPSPVWQSRFYCRATLRAAPAGPGAAPEAASGEPAMTRFLRAFAHEEHLSLSLCSASAAEQISLYGAIAVPVPYAALVEVRSEPDRRRWVFRPALNVGGHAVGQVEIDLPPVEAADWAVLDRLIEERGSVSGSHPGPQRLVTGVYAIGGVAEGRWLGEEDDQARILLGEDALVLLEAATGSSLAAIPYAAIHACAIERHDPSDDFLVVAPGVAVVLRQAGVGVRHAAAHSPDFAGLMRKLESGTATVVEQFSGVLGRPEALPAALRVERAVLHADWGLGTAALPVAEITTRRLDRETAGLRLVVGRSGQEWTARGSAERLLPLAQALEEAALPGELARESLSGLYHRWQRCRPELLLWGLLGDIAGLDLLLARLSEETAAAMADGGPLAAASCDLLAASLENVKAKLALSDLYLPYCLASEEESFLERLGAAAAPVRERSCRYAERAVKALLRSPLAHLRHSLAEIEKNLAARDELRQVPRPGKLTLGFDASYCATIATALGASVFGPLGAVAGVALSSLKLNQDTHSHNDLQESLIRDYESNALTWWRHLNDRVLPLLVRELVAECDRLSRSLAPRDAQIYARLARTDPADAEPRFRAALAAMLEAHSRFRWGRLEVGEPLTAGELLDRLTAAPPPAALFSRLFPMAARHFAESA